MTTATDSWIDWRVLLAAALATLAAAVMFGVTPLMRGRDALSLSLRTGMKGATADRRTRAIRQAIVAGQIALSVMLLVGAGLLIRSFVSLQSRGFGFNPEDVTTAQIVLPRDRYATTAQSAEFLRQLVAEASALPGVQSAAAINTLPLTGFNALRPHFLPGRQPAQDRFAEFRVVTPDYFRTMAIPLQRGRVFDDNDRPGAQDVVIVNETLAQRMWPGADPIGQVLMVPDFGTPAGRIVVGVVGDTRHHDLTKDPEPEIYRPAYQTYWPFFGLVLRTASAADTIERPLRDAAARVDRSVPIASVRALSALADKTLAWRRSSMALLTVFALAAGFLAFVGVYSVMAYSVAARAKEFGVRVALGAAPSTVAAAIVAQGTRLAAVGIVVGLVAAAATGRLIGTLLFAVHADRSADVRRRRDRHWRRRRAGDDDAGADRDARGSVGGAARGRVTIVLSAGCACASSQRTLRMRVISQRACCAGASSLRRMLRRRLISQRACCAGASSLSAHAAHALL